MKRLEEIKIVISDNESVILEEIEKIEARFSEESIEKELKVFQVVTEKHLVNSLKYLKGGNRWFSDPKVNLYIIAQVIFASKFTKLCGGSKMKQVSRQ